MKKILSFLTTFPFTLIAFIIPTKNKRWWITWEPTMTNIFVKYKWSNKLIMPFISENYLKKVSAYKCSYLLSFYFFPVILPCLLPYSCSLRLAWFALDGSYIGIPLHLRNPWLSERIKVSIFILFMSPILDKSREATLCTSWENFSGFYKFPRLSYGRNQRIYIWYMEYPLYPSVSGSNKS